MLYNGNDHFWSQEILVTAVVMEDHEQVKKLPNKSNCFFKIVLLLVFMLLPADYNFPTTVHWFLRKGLFVSLQASKSLSNEWWWKTKTVRACWNFFSTALRLLKTFIKTFYDECMFRIKNVVNNPNIRAWHVQHPDEHNLVAINSPSVMTWCYMSE